MERNDEIGEDETLVMKPFVATHGGSPRRLWLEETRVSRTTRAQYRCSLKISKLFPEMQKCYYDDWSTENSNQRMLQIRHNAIESGRLVKDYSFY